MSFPKIRITDAGKVLLASTMGGENKSLKFTKFMIGSGETAADPEEWDSFTELIHPMLNVSFSEYVREDDTVFLSGEFSNAVAQNEFFWRELGIYGCQVNNGTDGEETLLFYGNAQGLSEFVPAADAEVSVRHRWRTALVISSATDVSAVVRTITYATTADLDQHIDDHDNPHQVTKEQVGLGNVPNVSTNDQTPTFTEPSHPIAINSGDKLSIIMGRISSAVKAIIQHLQDYGNPHNITPTKIGAAAAAHTHSAPDITSGTLPVARGGTGKAAWVARRLLFASATGTLAQIPLPTQNGSVLTCHPDQEPYWAPPSATDFGKYSGTGTYGASNKTSLTFAEVPSIIFIRTNSDASVGFSWGVLFVQANNGFSYYGVGNTQIGYCSELAVSCTQVSAGWKVEWYTTDSNPSAAKQLNHQQHANNYSYVAIY